MGIKPGHQKTDFGPTQNRPQAEEGSRELVARNNQPREEAKTSSRGDFIDQNYSATTVIRRR
jgi:hypothetical protein